MTTTTLEFTVIQGHQVASGQNKETPFLDGTIKLQKPVFKTLGYDISWCFNGTINAQFDAFNAIELNKHDIELQHVHWHAGFSAESFQFVNCQLRYEKKTYRAVVYQPVKETKIGHIQPLNVLEVLAEPIENLNYGDRVALIISADYLVTS